MSSSFITNNIQETKINIADLQKRQLTQKDNPETQISTWCFNSRTGRNITRVVVAGGLSAVGSYVSSFWP